MPALIIDGHRRHVDDLGWYVACNDHRKGPFKTEADAKKAMEGIKKMGACPLEHKVVQACR